MAEAAQEEIRLEVAPGHLVVGVVPPAPAPPSQLRYSCSCGELTDVGADVIQDHVDDVTP